MTYLYILIGVLALIAGKLLIDVRRLTKTYCSLMLRKKLVANTQTARN